MSDLAAWQTDIPLLRRLHRITLPTPFAVGPVHTYLAEGEPLTLIDTGLDTEDALTALHAGLSALGYGLSDVQRIVITHSHVDHYGLAHRIATAGTAEVLAHPLAQPILEDWQESRVQREGFGYALLRSAGVPEDLVQRTGRLLRSYDFFQRPVRLTGVLEDGATLTMAGADWQVLYCPGHAADLICFYEPASRVLIGNDHLLAHISSNAIVSAPPLGEAVRRRPLIDYWESLRRVAAMDLALTLTGHGEAVSDTRGLINQRFAFHQRRLARLVELMAGGSQTVWQLAQGLLPRMGTNDTFLAVSEVVGHLDVLEMEGKVTMQTDIHGVWRYAFAERRTQHESSRILRG